MLIANHINHIVIGKRDSASMHEAECDDSPCHTKPLVGGCYRIVGDLGCGGGGIVHEAEDVETGERVALKLMSMALLHRVDARKQFHREIAFVKRCSGKSPHFARFCGSGVDDRRGPFYAVSLIEGETLQQRLSRGRLSVRESLSIFGQLCDAVELLHEHWILHRDIKPTNIILQPVEGGYRVVLIDFGIARSLVQVGADAQPVGAALGTPLYMSPEQCRDEVEDEHSEQYVLGLLLYRLLADEHPFDAEELGSFGVILAHDRKTPMPLSARALPFEIPAALDAALLRALAKTSEQRWPSIRAFKRHILLYRDILDAQALLT